MEENTKKKSHLFSALIGYCAGTGSPGMLILTSMVFKPAAGTRFSHKTALISCVFNAGIHAGLIYMQNDSTQGEQTETPTAVVEQDQRTPNPNLSLTRN